jgi:hypothetical protein
MRASPWFRRCRERRWTDADGKGYSRLVVSSTVPVAFVSGHLDLTDAEFAAHYVPQIEAAKARGCQFIVGDARGADLLFQQYAVRKRLNVTVVHMYDRPRNNVGDFPLVGGFRSDADRDAAMTAASSFDIAWVRPGRQRSGTAKNLQRRASATNRG